jgi:hypothetical protein
MLLWIPGERLGLQGNLEDVVIGGNNTKKYTVLNFLLE